MLDTDDDAQLPDGAAAAAVIAAAPDAQVLPVPVLDDDGEGTADDLATGIADAAEQRVGVIALTLAGDPEALAGLADETVQRAIRAASDAGSVIVAGEPGPDVELPEDLPVLLVSAGPPVADRAVSGGDVEPLTATALVSGTAALLVGPTRGTALVDVIVNTVQGPDRTVDAAAAVAQASNVGAGGQALPPPEDLEGGLSPGTVGAIVFGAAIAAVGGTIWIGSRSPRRRAG